MKWISIPTPFPIGPVNVCLVKSDPVTLIDCGPDTEEAYKVLNKALNDSNLVLADIERVILTHFHHDHSGLCRRIKDASGAEIYAHESEIDYLIGEPEKVRMRWADRIQKFFCKSGVPFRDSEWILNWFRKKGPTLGGIGGITFVKDGDKICLGDYTVVIRHTPGHSPGSIILNAPAEEFIVSGDSLLMDVTPNPLVELDHSGGRTYSSLSAYLESVETIEKSGWIQTYPGHCLQFIRHESVFEKIRNEIRDRSFKVGDLIRDEPRTAYEIAGALFGKVEGGQVFLAVSEASSHLDYLVERGLASIVEDGPVELYMAMTK